MFSSFINKMSKEELRKQATISTYHWKNLNSDLKDKNVSFSTHWTAWMMIYHLKNSDLQNDYKRRQNQCQYHHVCFQLIWSQHSSLESFDFSRTSCQRKRCISVNSIFTCRYQSCHLLSSMSESQSLKDQQNFRQVLLHWVHDTTQYRLMIQMTTLEKFFEQNSDNDREQSLLQLMLMCLDT
jgi:hypothetical protein